MQLFDTHCHFDFDAFSGVLDSAVQQCVENGVTRFLLPSIGPDNWLKLNTLSKANPRFYYALGFHPYFLERYNTVELESLESMLRQRSGSCVAVGECGLDFSVDVSQIKQEQFLIEQIGLAQRYKLPMIVHSRQAHNRLIQVFKSQRFEYGGVLHGFSGSAQQARQWIDLGFKIGVGGSITYPRASKTRNTVAQLPLHSIVLETDAPDMPLNGRQGQPNHPKYLPIILDELVLLRNESKQTVASQVWKNSNLAFGICE